MWPVVRHWIVCEDVRYGDRPEQFTLSNVICRIRALDPEPFPLLYRQLCFMALCTECRGPASIQVQIVEEGTAETCYESPEWSITFTNEPLRVHGFPFRILNLQFPRPGIYSARFVYNSRILAVEPLRLTE
jgi:hypothetical protein